MKLRRKVWLLSGSRPAGVEGDDQDRRPRCQLLTFLLPFDSPVQIVKTAFRAPCLSCCEAHYPKMASYSLSPDRAMAVRYDR